MDPRMTDLYDLTHLDPAQGRSLTDTEMIRGRAQLERIVAAPPAVEKPQRARRRVAAVSALAGGLTASAVLATTIIGGTTTAYADWTPKASNISAKQAVEDANNCLRNQPSPVTVDASDILLAERRGAGETILVQNGESVAFCSIDKLGEVSLQSVQTEAAEGPNAGKPLAPDRIRLGALSSGPLSSEGKPASKGHVDITGRVGADVTGVDILTEKGRVEATISNGYFVAWWPSTKDQVDNLVIHLKDGTSTTKPWTEYWS